MGKIFGKFAGIIGKYFEHSYVIGKPKFGAFITKYTIFQFNHPTSYMV